MILTRNFLFFVLCFFYLFAFNSALGQKLPSPPPPPNPPSAPISPLDGAEAIQLTSGLILELKWEPVADATKYLYQYWKKGDPIPALELEASIARSELLPLTEAQPGITLLQPGAKYLWRVRACNDNDCGNYSDNWSFVFRLSPPEKIIIDPRFPVTIGWSNAKVAGAKSYIIEPKIDVGAWSWNPLDPIKRYLFDPIVNWLGFKTYDPSCPWLFWDEPAGKNGECLSLPAASSSAKFVDDTCIFAKNVPYKIKAASCLDEKADYCGPYGNEWKFTASNIDAASGKPFTLSPPKLKTPLFIPGKNIPIVGQADYLMWESPTCSSFVLLFIAKSGGGNIIDEKLPVPDAGIMPMSDEHLKDLFSKIENLNQEYTWKLQPCWQGEENIKCEPNVYSEEWRFKTTGRPPTLSKPDGGKSASIPVSLQWEKIEGAGSYRYQIASNNTFSSLAEEGTTTNSQKEINYPSVSPNDSYWWRVKTCADARGNVCGLWSSPAAFTTLPLNPPSNLSPTNGLLPAVIKWDPDPGANFYQYKIDYVSATYQSPGGATLKENRVGCQNKIGAPIAAPTITSQASATIYENCLGEYKWWVRSCLDKDCVVAAPAGLNSAPRQTFTAFGITATPEKGLVPCGRREDNPLTPYDETESCQFKHVGFVIQNILDFLLWRLGIIVLGILSIASGATIYFSFGNPNTIVQVKSIWKSAGIGWLAMLLAWIIINLIMNLIGFQGKFFGHWWQLPF
ncbi:MAG: hypothetical protein Q7K28_00010 [Candidatus Wildermuthbacteria bacterium]|nr:hypothetical protein [Candidatus Wildermuthbacteria bacterium]